VHLIIAAVEGVVTFAVILFIHKMRPSLVLGGAQVEGKMSARAVAASLLVAALVVGGFFSLLASGLPDGLEFVLGGAGGEGAGRPVLERPVIDEGKVPPSAEAVASFQENLAPLPDYSKRATGGAEPAAWWTSLSGVAGSLLVLVVMSGVAWGLRRKKEARAASQ